MLADSLGNFKSAGYVCDFKYHTVTILESESVLSFPMFEDRDATVGEIRCQMFKWWGESSESPDECSAIVSVQELRKIYV